MLMDTHRRDAVIGAANDVAGSLITIPLSELGGNTRRPGTGAGRKALLARGARVSLVPEGRRVTLRATPLGSASLRIGLESRAFDR